MKFAENFIDASETDQHDARASMNRHNNRVGRRVSPYFVLVIKNDDRNTADGTSVHLYGRFEVRSEVQS